MSKRRLATRRFLSVCALLLAACATELGTGTSGAQQVAATAASDKRQATRARMMNPQYPAAKSRPFSVFGADLDGDGDLDVLSASQMDSKIAWYENTD